MHALLITFTSRAREDDLRQIAIPFAEALRDVPGLLSKAWLANADEGTSGGFYLFEDRAAADAYVNGPLVARLRANPHFSDFILRRFAVDPVLSARTGLVASAIGPQ